MKKIGKYEFNNKVTADRMIEAFEESNHTFVRLGNIVIVPGEYDMEGNEITPTVLSEMYHVDVLWKDLEHEPNGWANYAADVDDNGVHSFAGLNYADYKF